MKVLGISSSPREQSNSDLLLRKALSGASSVGAEAEYMRLNKLHMAPCSECGACYTSGRCPVEDDFQMVLAKMLEADRLIFATPIFFMNVCAQAKVLIDRCQGLWALKYLLKQPIDAVKNRRRLGMVIAVGGTKNKKMFESVRLTMKYYLDALDMGYFANLFICNIDGAGIIADNKEAMEQAFRLGAELVVAGGVLENSIDVEITG